MGRLSEALKNKRTRTICYGIFLGLICQLYISPVGYASYVVSLGTPVLNALLLFQPELPVFPLMAVMSAVACLLRGLSGMAAEGSSFRGMFLPALFYYGIYTLLLSFLFYFFKKRQKFLLMLGMTVCDFAANAIQLALMGHAEGRAVTYSLLVALIRGTFVWIIYWMYEWEHLYLRKKEHQKHYAQLNQIVTDIYAESFYLRKSMEDLNELTKKSHHLYENLKGQPPYEEAALDIAREAHEIRKDYQRIVQGISSLVREHEEKSMGLSAVFRIIEENTKRQIQERGGHIALRMKCEKDVQVSHYYDLFTILNNLIVNSLDACRKQEEIQVIAEVRDSTLVVLVADNGCGIEPDMLQVIWGAGFSTKYDEKTGVMSTGIGLCHVENILRHLEGKIEVESEPGRGSRFYVRIPLSSLQENNKNGVKP